MTTWQGKVNQMLIRSINHPKKSQFNIWYQFNDNSYVSGFDVQAGEEFSVNFEMDW